MDKKKFDLWLTDIQNGNEDAFILLYNESYRGVLSFVFSIVEDFQTAEDVAQETFIKVRKYVQSYQSGTNASAWILQIAKNPLHLTTSKSACLAQVLTMQCFWLRRKGVH